MDKRIILMIIQTFFANIGYKFGNSGINFRVPDLRGRVVLGEGAGEGLTSRSISDVGGTELVAPHEHDLFNQNAYNNGLKLFADDSLIQEAGSADNSSYSFNNNNNKSGSNLEGYWNIVRARKTDTGIRTPAYGNFDDTAVRIDPDATEQMPPYNVLKYIIKT